MLWMVYQYYSNQLNMLPALKEIFKFSNHPRGSLCIICNHRVLPLKSITAAVTLKLHSKYKILFHSQKDKICESCKDNNNFVLKQEFIDQYVKQSSVFDDLNIGGTRRIVLC